MPTSKGRDAARKRAQFWKDPERKAKAIAKFRETMAERGLKNGRSPKGTQGPLALSGDIRASIARGKQDLEGV